MIKIMIADDEGIAVEAIKFIVENTLSEPYVVESAKTGREVIELAERFRPDIAFMDIHMPGISGIKAMQEIRKTNSKVLFIVVSAYEKFDYAKDAIGIGVLDYLNKPIQKEKLAEVLNKAVEQVNRNKEQRAVELEIQEKLETVLPVIENGMIYSILFQDDYADEVESYRTLLGIDSPAGYIVDIRFGESIYKGRLTNAIGTTVKAQPNYDKMRNIIKEYTNGIVGAVMGNSVVVMVPKDTVDDEYEERIHTIDKMCEMVRELRQNIGGEYRIGIGGTGTLSAMPESFKEAREALRVSKSTVAHVKDLPIGCNYEGDYPVDVEKKIFTAVENGDVVGVTEGTETFFNWMENNVAENIDDIRLKILEFVLGAEKIAYQSGGMTYRFTARHTYLEEINQSSDLEMLKKWYQDKMLQATENVKARKKESAFDVIDRAKRYITDNYRNASLDSIARYLDISPYYFSKLFKDKTGENFIEYLTDFKIEKAKEMIADQNKSMKEICLDIGYANP
ncbi:MAG: response regulator, partial [Lachnospiraceae bacterium]|nr:response regulator [Lachnospiraceae bacterium]